MNDRSKTMIALISATLLCGLPGLLSLCCGAALLVAGYNPESSFTGDMTPELSRRLGVAGLCLGVVFVMVPLAVGYFTRRRKPEIPEVNWDEPIPPAI